MSNRIAVFNDGKIQQLASPTDLYERPENAFVAQFIGENNRLFGKVKDINGENCVITLDNGEDVHALKINVKNVGEKSLLSLRPERVAINPKDKKFDNVFEGKVEELTYLGDHIRTRATVCGHTDFIVKVSNSGSYEFLKEGATANLDGHRLIAGRWMREIRNKELSNLLLYFFHSRLDLFISYFYF